MNYRNLNEVLAKHAIASPNKIVFRFKNEDDSEETITYGSFYKQVKAVSAKVRQNINFGDRVLLLYPPSIDYIIAFFACLDAGAIAVPSYTPNKRNLTKLSGIIKDAGIKVALCNKNVVALLGVLKLKNAEKIDKLINVQLIQSDTGLDIDNIDYSNNLNIDVDNIAFLQYTSGSTSFPKGVNVTHNNLLTNSECIRNGLGIHEGSYMVSWLPPFHDMGLIGVIIQTIYSGISATLMAPVTFIKKPVRWLTAIAEAVDYGSVISGAPNFAYDLCVNKVDVEQLPKNFDLSIWKCAFSGAEPVRAKTLRRFYQKYKDVGFQYNNFLPVYGLAEGTLMATGGHLTNEPIIKSFDLTQIEENSQAVIVGQEHEERSKEYVACGFEIPNHDVKIVDPYTLENCKENEIGEIWIRGESVANGYWFNTEKTISTFHAFTAKKHGPYLRTGDMGFFCEGELYITGRIKDMIIINGKNYYPEDIEITVCAAHSDLRPGGTAAFMVEQDEQEKLVIVQEVKRSVLRSFSQKEIMTAIRRDVQLKHQLPVDTVVLIATSSISKTTSGKIQRYKVRRQYEQSGLKQLAKWSLQDLFQSTTA